MQLKWLFIRVEFAEVYLEKLRTLIYPDCFVSCFSKDYSNSSMWGNYADRHRGACLIFKTKELEGKQYLPYSINSRGVTRKYVDLELSRVIYDSKVESINFFDSLGRLNGIQLINWLIDDNDISKNYEQIYRDKDSWREGYWNIFKKGICSKTLDWEYEEEYRLYITNTFFDFTKTKDRAIKYKFEDLYGIIFGINTSMQDKIKIIKIVIKKCQEEKSDRFNFYQAVYDNDLGRIKITELGFLSNIGDWVDIYNT